MCASFQSIPTAVLAPRKEIPASIG